uniref:Large ribosomal subunit protein eL28 n=2 Tax=Pristionchus pacificus TaxID=54126 RepID=A0A454XI72_PRIPA|eukprot:PDM60963.1 rpl-28 [Pristionchus pacificus]
MSNDVAWQVIRNNSAFIRRQRGIQKAFSREPLNLKGINSPNYNGLTNAKAIGVTLAEDNKSVVVTVKKSGKKNLPAKSLIKTTIKRGGARGIIKSVQGLVKGRNARFAKLAARRASQLLRSVQRSAKIAKKSSA